MSASEYDAKNPWLRQPCDNDQSFALFQEYLTLGPSRSIAALYRRIDRLPISRLYDLAHSAAWELRAKAWDRHLERVRVEAVEEAIEEDAKAIAKRHGRVLRDALTLADLELSKYLSAAKSGDMHGLLSPTEVLRFIHRVIPLERLVAGEATERVETSPDISKLSLEQLRELKIMQEQAGAR